MVGKILKALMLLVLSVLIFCAASIAGVRNDDKRAKRLAQEQVEAEAAEAAAPKDISSPYTPYSGGVLDLQIDYEVQVSGSDVLVSVVSNLPDGYELTGELSNIEDVKKELGFEGVSSSALTADEMNSINEHTYNSRDKNFVTNGVCNFTFKEPPTGQLDLKITSPITKLQPSAVQELLGEKGANLQGNYVVYLEEVADKSVNFTASFVVEEKDGGVEEEAAKE